MHDTVAAAAKTDTLFNYRNIHTDLTKGGSI